MIRVLLLLFFAALVGCGPSAGSQPGGSPSAIPTTDRSLPAGSAPTFPSVAFERGSFAAPDAGQTVTVRVRVAGVRGPYRIRWVVAPGTGLRLVPRSPQAGTGPAPAGFEAALTVSGAIDGPKTLWAVVEPQKGRGVLVRAAAVIH